MKPYFVIYVAIILIIGIGCQQKPVILTDEQKAEIVKEVTVRHTEFIKVVSDMNVQAYPQFLSSNYLAFITQLGTYLNRQVLVDSVINSWWPKRLSQLQEAQMVKVYPLSSELAIVDRIASVTQNLKDGTVKKKQVSVTYTWQKEPSGWYIIHIHESWKDLK